MPPDYPQTVGSLADPSSLTPVGRFAPSPTGDLHFGSLLAAMASYCDIKQRDGLWLLRIDDIDGPRSVPGSADSIQHSLEQFGFEWDGPVQSQSQHAERYKSALAAMISQKRIFACSCSRRSLPTGEIYPGLCRQNTVLYDATTSDYTVKDHALRATLTGSVSFIDAIQGPQHTQLEQHLGDIIVWRRDNFVAYALACAVDDAQAVTHVVRGADLLGNTSAQLAVMQLLGLSEPVYAHIPVAVDADGHKLSKNSNAASIAEGSALPLLLKAWHFLGQDNIQASSVSDFWSTAIKQWKLSCVPAHMTVAL